MRPSRLRWAIFVALAVVGGGSVFGLLSVDSVAGPGETAARKPAGDDASAFGKAAGEGDEDSGQCLANAAAIEDIRQQREKLTEMKKELDAKEAELKAREQAVADEMKKLEQVRQDIAKTEDLKKQENEEKVAKLVQTIESMSPKPAAQLLSSIDETLAVTAMQSVSTAKLAKIMNVMDPGHSSRLTEVLAGVVRARALSPSAGAQQQLRAQNDAGRMGTTNNNPSNDVKGGESNGQRSNSGEAGAISPATPGNNDGRAQNQGQRQPASGAAARKGP